MFDRCARHGLILAHGAVGDQAPFNVTRVWDVVRRSQPVARARADRVGGDRGMAMWESLHKHGACDPRAQIRCVWWPCTNTVQREFLHTCGALFGADATYNTNETDDMEAGSCAVEFVCAG